MRLMRGASIVPCTSFLFGRLGLERVERLDRLARRHLIRIERRQRGDHEVAGLIQGGRTRAWACGRGEQRQVINQPTRMRGAILRFELGQDELGALDHRRRQAGELGNRDPVGAVGGARYHLVQEHHVALPFLDPHGHVGEAIELAGKRRELVEVSCEQGAAAIGLMQVLDRRPGDRQPVESRGAAPDLVEDHERAPAGLIEDRCGLDHLDHEGRAPAREIVGGADA